MYLRTNEKTAAQFETVTGFPKMSLEEARKVRAAAQLRRKYQQAVDERLT